MTRRRSQPPRGGDSDAYIDMVLEEAQREDLGDTVACEPPDFSAIPDPEARPLDDFDDEAPTSAFVNEGPSLPPRAGPPPLRPAAARPPAFPSEPSVMVDLPELEELNSAPPRRVEVDDDSALFGMPDFSISPRSGPQRPPASPIEETVDMRAARHRRGGGPPPMPPPRAVQPRGRPEPRAAQVEEGKETGFLEVSPSHEPPRAKLVIIAGTSIDSVWYLNRQITRVGRGDDCDIPLSDLGVSRHHAKIERHSEGFRLIDLNSANGTRLNHKRVEEAELYDGDRVQLGEHTLRFESLGAPRIRGRSQENTQPGFSISPAFFTPKSLVLWSVVTFVAVFSAMYVGRQLLRSEAPSEASADASVYLQGALEAIEASQWLSAREDLLVVDKLDPGRLDVAPLMARVEREMESEARLKRARRWFAEGAYAKLDGFFIDPKSVYAEQAIILKQRAVEAAIQQKVGRAQALFERGQIQSARALAQEILIDHPEQPEAKGLLDAIRRDAEEMRRANPRTLRRVKREMARAQTLYEEARFRDASEELERAWRRDVPRRLKNQAKNQARGLMTLHGHWTALARAEREDQREAAIGALEAAIEVDEQLGGAHVRRLRRRLDGQLYWQSYRAFKERRYADAAAIARRILKASPEHQDANSLLRAAEQRAAQILKTAKSHRDSAPDRARRLAEEAQRISAPGNAVYEEAAAFLSRLAH